MMKLMIHQYPNVSPGGVKILDRCPPLRGAMDAMDAMAMWAMGAAYIEAMEAMGGMAIHPG
jgi:hypothetical protein